MIDILGSHQTWALRSGHLSALTALETLYASGVRMKTWELRALLGLPDDDARGLTRRGSRVAVVPVHGLLVPHVTLFGRRIPGGTAHARAAFREALSHPDVSQIVLDIDSTGGSTIGIEELWTEIHAARSRKRVVAAVNSLASSAAYWLASAAHEIALTPSGHVGGVGVLGVHTDMSEAAAKAGVKVSVVSAAKFKHEAGEFTPLSPHARAHLQSLVDRVYDVMTAQIARGRGVSQRSVREGFGEGRVVHARDAVRLGLADRVEPFDKTIARVSGFKPRPLTAEEKSVRAEMDIYQMEIEHARLERRMAALEARERKYEPAHVLAEIRQLEER